MIRVIQKNNSDGRGPSSPNFPRVSNRGPGGPLTEDISFDEYIGEVLGSVAFTATKYPLQPGIVGTFPKGSVKAALYSEWKQIQCEFYYKPEVSGFATQGQGGKVILAMDYNAGNPAPTTKQQVEIMHRVDDMPYEKMALRLDSGSVNRSDAKYIRTGPIPVDEDIKTFDGGNLWVCTIGQANANVVGELHARYTFRCTKPTLLNPAQGALLPNATAAIFASAPGGEAAGATTVSKQMVFATAVQNGLGVVNTVGSFVPKAGTYLVDIDIVANNNASNQQFISIDLLKNGSTVLPATNTETSGAAAGVFEYMPMHLSQLITANGADAFTVNVQDSYAGGVELNWGTIRFLAV